MADGSALGDELLDRGFGSFGVGPARAHPDHWPDAFSGGEHGGGNALEAIILDYLGPVVLRDGYQPMRKLVVRGELLEHVLLFIGIQTALDFRFASVFVLDAFADGLEPSIFLIEAVGLEVGS